MIVAPYVGAWIETIPSPTNFANSMSHPMWVRGLKQKMLTFMVKLPLSHPMWVRGLKPSCLVEHVATLGVAPYVGAWIETRHISTN